jgi:hypothetical protein
MSGSWGFLEFPGRSGSYQGSLGQDNSVEGPVKDWLGGLFKQVQDALYPQDESILVLLR